MHSKLSFRQPKKIEVVLDARGKTQHEEFVLLTRPVADTIRLELLDEVAACGYARDIRTIQWDWTYNHESKICVISVWHAPEHLPLEMVGGAADGELLKSEEPTPKRFISLREVSTDIWCECGCTGEPELDSGVLPVVLDPFKPEWVTYERRGLTEDGRRWAFTPKDES